ncbi:MAG: hypothetical protein C4326_06595 [Ignavibacteria bacterium]
MSRRVLFILLCTLSSIRLAYTQGGTLTGRITSKADNEPLVGVNVLLKGTLRGATSDSRGEYKIANIPPGDYTVIFSLVGFERATHTNVRIEAGAVVQLDVALTPTEIQTEQIVVTASKRPQSLEEVPVSIALLDAKEISYRNSLTIDDALRYVPGVNMTEWQVNIRGSSGYSRGVGSRVLMLVDGIPLLTGDTGELNFETIPIGQVDRIEVVKGASSALYGSSALGGVINVITKPIPEEPFTRIRLYGGFYSKPTYSEWDWGGGTRFSDGESVNHSRKFDDLGMSLYLSRIADDGYRQNDYRRRYNGYLKLHYQFSDAEVVTTSFSLLDQKRGSFLYWKALNYALTPPETQLGDEVRSTRLYLTSQYSHVVSDKLTYAVKALWYRNKWEDTIDLGSRTSRSDVLRGEGQASMLVDDRQTLTAGIEGSLDFVRADLFGKRSGAGVALYAQDEIRLNESVTLSLGARYDFQDIDSLETSRQFNPKAGIVYTPVEGTTLRASYGRGFRAPAVAEAFISTSVSGLIVDPNPNLKPERSSSYEIGISQRIGDYATLDAAAFQSDFDNLIEPGFTASGRGQFMNVTKARVRGLELSAKASFWERLLTLGISYTYVYPRDISKNDILKYRPRHLFYANALLSVDIFTLGLDFRFISRMERIDDEFVRLGIVRDGDQRVAAYVTDVRAGADLTKLGLPLTVTLNVTNIFQYYYVELIGNLMPPRNTVFVLEWRP